MKEESKTFIKSAINHGVIFGIILIIIQLGMWMFNFMPVGIGKGILVFVINVLIYVFGIYWCIKTYRNSSLNGFISFGKAFTYGLLVFFVATVVGAIYNYLFTKFIDPGYTARILQETANWTEEYMKSKGVPEEQITRSLDRISSRKIPTPLGGSLKSLIFGVIGGAIVSLISSAFAKKEEEPFKEK